LVDGAHGHGAQVRLEFGEGHFDGIEVGAVGPQKHEPSAALADGLLGGRAFVGGQVVQNDDVALLQGWDELGAHVGLEDGGSIGASMTQGAVRAQRSPATKVWVFQWPKGALERRRSPLSQRPRARVIFVLVPVSSMNTSRCGLVCILGCRSGFHASRAWRTSGRSHSLA
jgi:hypothetical protein